MGLSGPVIDPVAAPNKSFFNTPQPLVVWGRLWAKFGISRTASDHTQAQSSTIHHFRRFSECFGTSLGVALGASSWISYQGSPARWEGTMGGCRERFSDYDEQSCVYFLDVTDRVEQTSIGIWILGQISCQTWYQGRARVEGSVSRTRRWCGRRWLAYGRPPLLVQEATNAILAIPHLGAANPSQPANVPWEPPRFFRPWWSWLKEDRFIAQEW